MNYTWILSFLCHSYVLLPSKSLEDELTKSEYILTFEGMTVFRGTAA